MDGIQFSVLDDDNEAIALSVKAQLDGFAGEADAYFDCNALLAFAEALEVFPITANRAPEMVSGVKGAHPSSQQGELLRVAVVPHDSLGKLRLEVQLTARSTPWIIPVVRSVTAWRIVTYEDATKVASAVRSLVRRENKATQVQFKDAQ